nr:MAG TPA: hypothetical protein [Caudoviricetes sp.]
MANAKLGTKAVGSIVKLKVGGTAKEFIVVHQGKPGSMYDESCNGTWLLMKDIYENRQWLSWDDNNLENSTILSYLNGPFFNLFDSNIKDAIKQVKIPYRKNGGSGGTDQSGANGLSVKIFFLSGLEVGLTTSDNWYFPQDGAKLSYFESGTGTSANNKRIAKLNGKADIWWLRSPNAQYTDYVWVVISNGYYSYSVASNPQGVRPALILPPDMEVDSSGNVTPPAPPATHKTLINGTAYEVKGGKCMVNGTVYNILKGRTLIGGTGYDITFPESLVMPVKGDLITMNLDGTDRLYRVLKIVNGTTVEVLGMWDGLSSSFISDLNGSDIYAGSPLDSYLNTTWYNTLSSNAKAAIVPKNISLYRYRFNSSVYNQTTHASYADYSSKSLKSAILYERNIYALDIEDIEEYFGGTAGSVSLNTSGKFSGDDLVTLFWNTTAPGFIYMWLRSAAQDSSPSVWQVAGFYKQIAQVTGSSSKPSYVARPTFQIDLSKIDFTIN